MKITPPGGRVGVGIIGAGVISGQYLENLTRFPDLEVLFIADLDLERARERADEFGIVGSGSVAELLANDDVEIVVNLTIPAAHVDVALQVLRAGKHVWNEKSFSLDRESGLTLLAEARRLGLRAAGAPDTFLGDGLQLMQRRAADGTIGTPLTALAIFQSSGPESWHPNPEFLYSAGAGPLFDMGPYYLTALIQVFGPIRRVSATSSTSHGTRTIKSGPRSGEVFAVTVPTHYSALIEFESGASAVAIFSFQSPQRRAAFLEISGTESTMIAPNPNTFDGNVTIVTGDDRIDYPTSATVGRGHGVLELARAIRSSSPERASGELAFHVVDVMVSIGEAAESGDFVEVDSTVPPIPLLPAGWDPRAATLAQPTP